MANYYLLNGKYGEGHTLDLLVDGELKRDFIDIASLDLKTMDIPIEKSRQVLKEYNKDIDLTGKFYDAKYPYKKVETKTFAPFFKYDDYNRFQDDFRYFTEQRDFNAKKGNKIELEKNKKLELYIRRLLYDVIKNKTKAICKNDSIIGYDLKNEIELAIAATQFESVDNYLNRRYKLRSMIEHYTQLRNLTIEYLSYITGEKVASRTDLNKFNNYENYGMSPREELPNNQKSDKEVKYYQMTLKDFGLDK